MVNKVTLIGYLGADPEVRTLDNGATVGRFSLATNESYKDKEDNWQTITEWHNVVVWRDLAERAEKSLRKGALCYVSGKISIRKYTDKDGIERQIADIVADQFRLLQKKEGQGADNRFPDSEPAAQKSQTGRPNATQVDVPPAADGGDLPF